MITNLTVQKSAYTDLTSESLSYALSTIRAILDNFKVDIDIEIRSYRSDSKILASITKKPVYKKNEKDQIMLNKNENYTPIFDKYIFTKITINSFTIHECFNYWEKHSLTTFPIESLESIICHEIAHMTYWQHGKKHRELTELLLNTYLKSKYKKVC